jgi:hypothetical protein
MHAACIPTSNSACAESLPLLDLLIFQGAGPGATFRFLTASCRSHAWAARSLSPTCGCVSWAGAVGVARGSWASHGTCWPPHSARSPCSARSLSSTVRPRVARVELARRPSAAPAGSIQLDRVEGVICDQLTPPSASCGAKMPRDSRPLLRPVHRHRQQPRVRSLLPPRRPPRVCAARPTDVELLWFRPV